MSNAAKYLHVRWSVPVSDKCSFLPQFRECSTRRRRAQTCSRFFGYYALWSSTRTRCKRGLNAPLTLLAHADGGLDADRSTTRCPQSPHRQHPARVSLHRAGCTAAGQQPAALTAPPDCLNDHCNAPQMNKRCAGGMRAQRSLHLRRPCSTYPSVRKQLNEDCSACFC